MDAVHSESAMVYTPVPKLSSSKSTINNLRSSSLIARVTSKLKQQPSQVDPLYHLHTLWLFAVNDLKTIVFPSTLFAIVNSIVIFQTQEQMDRIEILTHILAQLPKVLIWTWTLLLCFTVNNQRLPQSIIEDTLNKSWRPVPAGRLSSSQAAILGIATYPLAFTVSLLVGGQIPCVLLFIFFVLHNDCGGANKHWLPRNLLNGVGIASFAAGALEVSLSSSPPSSMRASYAIIVALITTTIHSQDLYDQEGDAATDRRTIPLVFGDVPARWSVAIPVSIWSVWCPFFLNANLVGYAATILLGGWVAVRTVCKRSVVADRKSFRLYNAWLVAIYLLPLLVAS